MDEITPPGAPSEEGLVKRGVLADSSQLLSIEGLLQLQRAAWPRSNVSWGWLTKEGIEKTDHFGPKQNESDEVAEATLGPI